jgi:cytochrome oxidase Cu insertion factor (SCO1/SenC/PrrC family)
MHGAASRIDGFAGRAIVHLLVAIGFALAAAAVILWLAPPPPPAGSAAAKLVEAPPVQVDRAVPPFELVDQEGRRTTLEDLRGKVWVAGFVFTRCHLSCPTVTATMAALRDRLPEDVLFVSVSVDPRHDTPEVLSQYAQSVRATPDRWRFLTGDKDEVYRLVRDGFQFALEENPDPRASPGELVTHTNRLVVVDRKGVARYSYSSLDPAALAQIERVVRRLRNESP